MRAILIIIATIALLDVIWWLVCTRLCRATWWRLFNHIFLAAQSLGLLGLVLGRIGNCDLDRLMPKAVVAAVFIWHMIILPVVLVALLVALPFILIVAIARFRRGRATLTPRGMSRRQFLATTAAALPPLLTVSLTGVAMRQLAGFRIRHLDVPINGLPEALHGLTIAHVSDTHVGRFTSGRVLDDMVRAVNDLRSELVLFTGDLVNDELIDLDRGIDLLGRMGCSYTIEGNHDLIENGPEFERRMRESKIPFLLDQAATAELRGVTVQFLGLSWTRAHENRDQAIGKAVTQLLQQRDPAAFTILMAHHPHAFDAAAAANVPLILSGHTHGGQLMLNEQVGFGPALFRYWSGVYERNLSKLIVSNGVGNWFPLRVQAPAEIIHLTLVKA